MEALKKKLKCRRGASILLALLFFLICLMVGASLVMAAASNAGKIKSNKEEQQKYLTLSSAINLLIDRLEKVEYVGQYTYERKETWKKEVIEGPVTNADGTESWRVIDAWYELENVEHTYTQLENVLVPIPGKAKLDNWDLNVLPLYRYLDKIFSERFKVPDGMENPTDDYMYNELPGAAFADIGFSYLYTLDFETNLDKDLYGGLSDTVRITVTLNLADGEIDFGGIDLEATLMDKKDDGSLEETEYTMKARLKLDGNLDELLAPDGDLAYEMMTLDLKTNGAHVESTKTSGKAPTAALNEADMTVTYSGTITTNDPDPASTKPNCVTAPVTWKLNYFYKEEP